MRKIFITLGIYIILTVGVICTLASTGMIWFQQSGCLPYDNHDSFLAQWFDITYFEEKERYNSCMQTPDTYGRYVNQHQKELACQHPIITVPSVCVAPNFKPGIMYGIFGIGFLFLGMKLRKKYLLHL